VLSVFRHAQRFTCPLSSVSSLSARSLSSARSSVNSRRVFEVPWVFSRMPRRPAPAVGRRTARRCTSSRRRRRGTWSDIRPSGRGASCCQSAGALVAPPRARAPRAYWPEVVAVASWPHAGSSALRRTRQGYDEHLAEFTLAASEVIDRLLGVGSGRCLDLCCGTGLHLPRLLALDWKVTGGR
jgi:hypothetical protein